MSLNKYSIATIEMAKSGQLSDLSGNQRLLLITLCLFADKNGDCSPSQKEIASISGFTRPTVGRHLKVLCKLGYIESQQRMDTSGSLDTCLYSIKIPVKRANLRSVK